MVYIRHDLFALPILLYSTEGIFVEKTTLFNEISEENQYINQNSANQYT
jgi:hypothetical protein